MAGLLHLGVEIPSPELARLLGEQLGALPEALDDSGAAYVLLGADRADGADGARPSPSPTVVGTLLARRSGRIGIVVAASPQRDHPFNVARRVASLDHVSDGRAGLLGLARDGANGLGVADGSTWAPGPLGDEELADGLLAVRKLWRTWPVETLVEGPAAFERALRYADHVGVFPTRGPLNSPTTPQGEPVVFWRLRSSQPAELLPELATAVTVADVVLIDADVLGALDAGPRRAVGESVAAADPTVQLHVRVEGPARDLPERIARLSATPGLSGVTVVSSAADLQTFGRNLVPELASAGVVSPPAEPEPSSLRARLGIPRRAEPDLTGNPPAFPVVPLASKEPA